MSSGSHSPLPFTMRPPPRAPSSAPKSWMLSARLGVMRSTLSSTTRRISALYSEKHDLDDKRNQMQEHETLNKAR